MLAKSNFRPDAPEFVPSSYLAAWAKLQHAIKSVPTLNVQDLQVYGSTETGLGLEGADVDATVLVPGEEAVPVLKLLAKALPPLGFEVREQIYGARVPILRLREPGTAPNFHHAKFDANFVPDTPGMDVVG